MPGKYALPIGEIGKIDDIVLNKVCAALARWKEEGKELYPISVNLSRKRLYDENLIPHLVGIIDRYGVSHELIDFELTESATYDNKEQKAQVDRLRTLGCDTIQGYFYSKPIPIDEYEKKYLGGNVLR